MKTLLIFDLGGGDLSFKLVDDFLSKEIERWDDEHVECHADAWQRFVRDLVWVDDDNKSKSKRERRKIKKHILATFYVQSPVIEVLKKPIEADRVIYFR